MIAATIIVLTLLLIPAGVFRKTIHIYELPFNIPRFLISVFVYWYGFVKGIVSALWWAIAPKSWFEKHYMTLTQSQESINQFLDAIEKELKKEEKDNQAQK